MKRVAWLLALFVFVNISLGEDSGRLLSIDHYVRVRSAVPSIAGQMAQLYVRERVKAGMSVRTSSFANHVVLFVHGAGTPSEVAFDVRHQDYSWMAFLANAGFDVFSMDTTGYGRSTRPPAMNDPCNLTSDQQASFTSSCAPSEQHQLTTIASDWNDIGAVVDYLRTLRHVDRVSLIGWSLGGPRAAGYAAQHVEKVERLVLLAPAYNRGTPSDPPANVPAAGVPFNTQSFDEFAANWDRQVGCADQYDSAVSETVWSMLLESDPVGATWGTGVRRAPNTTIWGWNASMAARIQVPTLMVAGAHDKQVAPERVKELYADLGARQKVFVDLGCSSHMALWEKNHLLLFRASLEWLTKGSVNGTKEGMLRLGY